MAVPVAVDGYGADGGPGLVMEGAALAAAEGIAVRLFGPPDELGDPPPGVEVIASSEWIGNDEEPVAAVRSRPEASVVMAAADVAEGRSTALASAGSTGATMTAALFAMKRLQGVHRPALAAQVPLPGGGDRRLLLLDVGANVEVRAQHLIQFAHLGAAFSEAVLGVPSPKVGLLNVGEEQKKGTAMVTEAYDAMSTAEGLEFTGNVEGNELLSGRVDVVVTDGFTGNVALKLMEGTARAVAGAVRDAARGNPLSTLGGLMMRPALGGLRTSLDPNSVGGAILLGLRGVAVVAHGGSTPEGIANAVRLADRAAREQAAERTAERLKASGATRSGLKAGAAT